MKLLNKLALVSTMFAASILGQTAFAVDGFPLTITDAAGIEHKFETSPKIGCRWSGCTEMMADLGLQVHAASWFEPSQFGFPVGAPANLVEDWKNIEQWVATDVDVLLARVPNGKWSKYFEDVAPVFHLHHPSYGESNQTGYEAYIKNLELLGQLTGETAKADAALQRFNNMVANLKLLATDETRKNTVAIIRNGEGYRGFGDTNPFCVLIAEIGFGTCVPGKEAPAEYEFNPEAFLKLDPNWIVYMEGGYEDRNDPIWNRLSAVKNGQVFDSSDRFYCCSTYGLIPAMQDFTHYVVDDSVPLVGDINDFDPTKSPLAVDVK